MKAKLEIESTNIDIPLFIEILEWLQQCPVKELDITVNEMWLHKGNTKKESVETPKE